MRNCFLSFFLTTVILAFTGIVTSCDTSDQYLPEDIAQKEGVAVSFSVTKSNDDASTRIAYPSPTSNQLVWKSEDKIGVYAYCVPIPFLSFSNEAYKLESGKDTPVGVFNNDSWKRWYSLLTYNIYVYYPYSSDRANSNYDIAVKVPPLQTQAGPNTSDNLSANKFMYSSLEQQVIPLSGIVPIGKITNLASTIRFTATELNSDEKITSISISPSAGLPYLGYEGTFNLQSEEISYRKGYSSIRLDIGNGGLGNGDVAYMLVNTGFAGYSFVFNFEISSPTSTQPSVRVITKDNQSGRGKSGTGFTYPNGFRPHVILDVALSGKHSPERIADEQIWARAGNTDLNAGKGRANCYIVGKTGSYKFNGSYPGNSIDEADKFDLTNANAVLIWEDTPDLISDVNFGVDSKTGIRSGNILVTTNGKTGNAVVGWQRNGEVLWSWHIWVTENGTVDTFTQEGVGIFQTMNLGATSSDISNPASYGLYYQWGRKDPFISGNANYNSQTGDFFWVNASYTPTVDDAIKSPTTLYGGWIGNQTYEKWGSGKNTRYRDDSWGKFGNKSVAPSSSDLVIAKSLYDPCPYGYRVPSTDEIPQNALNYLPIAGYCDPSLSSLSWSPVSDHYQAYYWNNLAYEERNTGNKNAQAYRTRFTRYGGIGTYQGKMCFAVPIRCIQDNR